MIREEREVSIAVMEEDTFVHGECLYSSCILLFSSLFFFQFLYNFVFHNFIMLPTTYILATF